MVVVCIITTCYVHLYNAFKLVISSNVEIVCTRSYVTILPHCMIVGVSIVVDEVINVIAVVLPIATSSCSWLLFLTTPRTLKLRCRCYEFLANGIRAISLHSSVYLCNEFGHLLITF